MTLFEKYKFNVGAIENRKEYIRLISSAFLHADGMHLFFNMLSLYFFQGAVIDYFGDIGFLIIYFGSMILGNLFSLLIYKKQPWYSAIGASGAVSGIIFAAIAMAPVKIEVNFLPGWLFGTLYFGYSVYMMLNPKQWDNLGHAAHLGGAFFGLVYAVALHSQLAISNSLYLGAMSLPLIYLAYQIFVRKRIR
jgi:membrane associated rhomboid family serine protease